MQTFGNVLNLLTTVLWKMNDDMVAGAIESDLDLAYRLQLEEAMSASLIFQPSPSSNNSFRDGLQTIELHKFETEIKDRMIKEKLQVDLKRQVHDQNLALEISRMPEEHWQVLGDDYERPFGEGSSSSKSEEKPDVFRVYFKGLWDEGRYRGPNTSRKPNTLAGIGVAVCDSMDELVFELSKPLKLVKGEQLTRQSVELQALIEGLNAAIELNIKRIIFDCDYHPLYQSVSGQWSAKQQKIIDLLNKVNHFRSCFTYCEPSLIASKDVKFVFKLAREAISSQFSKMESSLAKLENCVICLDDKCLDQFFSIEVCTHRYCCSCVKQHVEVQLLNGVLPKCPHEGCGNELRIENCEEFLTPKFTEMMRHRLKEDSIPVTDKFYCPYPKCSTLMSRTDVFRLPILACAYVARRCYKCHGGFCVNCMVPWHKNMNCVEYKRRNPTQLVEESKLKNLAAKNFWRQCIKCKHMIELDTGCYHMTCRCGYEFCYTCGAEWRHKTATCSCPLWDEENIVDSSTDEEDDFEDESVIVHNDDDYSSDEGMNKV